MAVVIAGAGHPRHLGRLCAGRVRPVCSYRRHFVAVLYLCRPLHRDEAKVISILTTL
jgi:hypothetical protein